MAGPDDVPPMADPDEITLAFGTLALADKVEEHVIWKEQIAPHLERFPENVRRICDYGFTEILNNAIDHSEGKYVLFSLAWIDGRKIRITIKDDGIGIFEKIKSHFGLEDHRRAILELAKGRLTTDEARHSGEGIFFASRIFDSFMTIANHLSFNHTLAHGDWLIEPEIPQIPIPPQIPEHLIQLATANRGTSVWMGIDSDSKRTPKEVFDMFSDLQSDDYSFSKTHVPLRLTQYDPQQLVSRSMAKKVLSRIEGFKEVMLDFSGIDWIGQGFADEIFRVFQRAHPEIKIIALNASEAVQQMINRAQSHPDHLEGPKAEGNGE